MVYQPLMIRAFRNPNGSKQLNLLAKLTDVLPNLSPKKNNFLKKNKVYHEFGFISPGSGFTPFLLLNFRKLMSFLHPLHWVSRTDGPHDMQMIGPSLSLCEGIVPWGTLWSTYSIRKFPKMGLPPVIIHLCWGFSIIDHPYWSIPMETPRC